MQIIVLPFVEIASPSTRFVPVAFRLPISILIEDNKLHRNNRGPRVANSAEMRFLNVQRRVTLPMRCYFYLYARNVA